MKKTIPYGRQYIDLADVKAVSKALKNDKITTGNEVLKFEKKINSYLKCKYSISCNSGTSAIFLALQTIDLSKNDIILMPSINFVASYNVAKILGAKVFLTDVDKYSGQMTPKNVFDCIKKFKLKKIKAILLMYNGGYPDNAEKFYNFKKKYNCFIIEDACHALGSSYKIKNKTYKIGSCKHADISTFSLHPLKTITTGEGGLVTTNSKEFFNKMELLRSLGIKKSINKHWKYDVLFNSFNFRLNDFQCALGSSQLKKIDKFINSRKKIYETYNKFLKDIKEINLRKKNNFSSPSYHLYLINLNKPSIKKKEKLIEYMLGKGIYLQYHYIPIYKFKSFKGKYLSKNAEIYYNSTFSLPIYYKLSSKEQIYIIDKLKNYFNKNE